MICKDVCKDCINGDAKKIEGYTSWTSSDDMRWNQEGLVYCPVRWTNIDIDPPVWCPHIFEHAVGVGMTDVK
jgi:hypothetical protein